jgi:hypothetical protein
MRGGGSHVGAPLTAAAVFASEAPAGHAITARVIGQRLRATITVDEESMQINRHP